eukprot:gene17628-19382_t
MSSTNTPLLTTVVGSMPKPEYVQLPAWVKNGEEVIEFIEEYNDVLRKVRPEILQDQLAKATKEVIDLQQNIGIDIITDGELGREKYIYSFCRRLNGIDFDNQQKKLCRNGAWEGKLPIIVSEITPKGEPGWLAAEWKISQSLSKNQVKATVPGPMTIIDTTCNSFYKDEIEICKVLVKCINSELKMLVAAGCKQIQVK